MRMKAISLHQPWAELIASREKTIETCVADVGRTTNRAWPCRRQSLQGRAGCGDRRCAGGIV